jgi:hypothetical protein
MATTNALREVPHFPDRSTWLLDGLDASGDAAVHGLRRPHRQAYLDEFVFRFNRRRTPHAAFRTLLGIGTKIKPATYTMLIRPEAAG